MLLLHFGTFHNSMLPDESSIKIKTANIFTSTKFPCIRCGLKDIEITQVETYPDGIDMHGLRWPSAECRRLTKWIH
jgi:hypothetical protein